MARVIAILLAWIAAGAATARAETYRLQYQAEILGVVVLGEARYEVAASPQRYAVRGSLRTSGAARIFDQTQVTATTTGTISNGAIAWSRYDLSHAYARKFRRIAMTRANGAVRADIAPPYSDMGAPPATAAQQAVSYDPLTAIFVLGRQIGTARACRGAVPVFDGRQHFRLSVSPRAQGRFNGGGYNGPALVCAFRYEPIAGFSMNPAQRARIPVAEAWFALPARPGFAPPLRLTVPTPVGAAQLDLRAYQSVDASS
ncbi:MAG TPA: DUF3108 domain-containing protein [Caulobacterales bacterium]|nr:DUF3108 domain-containing protein [Caulobacterales bacterium]